MTFFVLSIWLICLCLATAAYMLHLLFIFCFYWRTYFGKVDDVSMKAIGLCLINSQLNFHYYAVIHFPLLGQNVLCIPNNYSLCVPNKCYLHTGEVITHTVSNKIGATWLRNTEPILKALKSFFKYSTFWNNPVPVFFKWPYSFYGWSRSRWFQARFWPDLPPTTCRNGVFIQISVWCQYDYFIALNQTGGSQMSKKT